MKKIGMIGGMSWESSLEYYRLLNQGIAKRLGGLHSATCLLESLDFAVVEQLQHAGDWEGLGVLLANAGKNLQQAGAQGLLIATNTMHKVAPSVEESTGLPLLHIVDATARAIQEAGMKTVGLLGTRFTMEDDFYRGRMQSLFDIATLVPDATGREAVHHTIYEELCKGVISEASRATFLEIVDALAAQGAEGIILGCTEIPLLITSTDTEVPLFDSTALHVEAALDWMLADV